MQENRKLVIIDDEEDLLELMEYHFMRKGFEVHAFENASSAWEFITQNRPDMILCDWMMPDMSGIEFCKKLKNDLSLADIPFIMVTCKSENSAVQMALKEGVSAYIKKPIRLPALVQQVSDFISLRTY